MVGGIAYAGNDPGVDPRVNGLQFLDAPTSVGLDGNIRVLWDMFNPPGGAVNYNGSTLQILDSNGRLLATGNPRIPGSVGFSGGPPIITWFNGYGYSTPAPDSSGFDQNRSNIIVKGQKSGNTTLAFLMHNVDTWPAGATIIVWTYNSAGALIAAAQYGPYVNTSLTDVRFADNGKLILQWSNQGTVAAWTLNEFGAVEAVAGLYGPYANWHLGKVDLGPDNGQRWFWVGPSQSGSGLNQTAGSVSSALIVWTFTPGGQLAQTIQYGSF
jgi:hypothetical protein